MRHGIVRAFLARWRMRREFRTSDGVPLLAVSPAPVAGESVHGYVRRLARSNGHVTLTTFLRALGLAGGFGPGSADVYWGRLSACTGRSASELAPMRWQAMRTDAGVRVTFLGHLLTSAFVHAVSMRVCPACLREDGNRRDFWALAHVVACPQHETILVEACPRCGRLFSPAAVGAMDGCVYGGAPTEAEPVEAPRFALAAAANLAMLVGEVLATGVARPEAVSTVPPAFEGLGLNDYISYLQVLGSAATTTEAEDVAVDPKARNYGRRRISRQPSIAETLSLLSGAESTMVDWPASFNVLLGKLDGRGRPAVEADSFEQAFSTALGRSLRHPMRGQDGLPLAMIVSAIDAYWNQRSDAFAITIVRSADFDCPRGMWKRGGIAVKDPSTGKGSRRRPRHAIARPTTCVEAYVSFRWRAFVYPMHPVYCCPPSTSGQVGSGCPKIARPEEG